MTKQGSTGSAKQICNFRVQTEQDWLDWEWFKSHCRKQGITTCRVLIAYIRSYRKFWESIDSPEIINAFPLMIKMKQQNTFVYSIEKPRRLPNLSQYVNNYLTVSNEAWVRSYILEKARFHWKKGQKSFCFKDYPEIKHQSFRHAILRLKQRKEVRAKEPRTCPRFYELLHPESEVVQ